MSPLTSPIFHFDRYKRLVRDGKLFSVFILFALCTLIFNSSAHSQTIAGSSFETPSVASSGGFSFNPVGSGWTFTGDSGIQSNGGFLAQNDPSLPNAPDGVQTAFIESYPGTTTGTVSQSLNFPNAGTYSISFLASSW